jgi:hypothetical protein
VRLRPSQGGAAGHHHASAFSDAIGTGMPLAWRIQVSRARHSTHLPLCPVTGHSGRWPGSGPARVRCPCGKAQPVHFLSSPCGNVERFLIWWHGQRKLSELNQNLLLRRQDSEPRSACHCEPRSACHCVHALRGPVS